MQKAIVLALCVMVFATLALAQNPAYTSGTGVQGGDKLGAHQNGGKGCVGCHAPHSGARGNGGNINGPAVSDPNTGNFALWGEDLGPLYSQKLGFGDNGDYAITFPADSISNESITTGVMMCLSCHDGNIAKGAMMTNQAYEQSSGILAAYLPNKYGPYRIPTLLGNDGTAAGNYQNDHPIGPDANLGAVGLVNASANPPVARVQYVVGGCGKAPNTTDCILPNPADTAYMAFYNHYGAWQTTQSNTTYPSGNRATPVVIVNVGDAASAYVVCTTCHTPHSMNVFSGTAATVKGVYPTYFFISAPYNPGAPIPNGNQASSATQFCRQCHFTGAGGSNEGSGIMNVTTSF